MAQVWPRFVTVTPDAPWDAFAADGVEASTGKLLIQNLGPANIHVADRTSVPTTADRGNEYPDVREDWYTATTIQFNKPPAGQTLYAWVLSGRARLAYQPDPNA